MPALASQISERDIVRAGFDPAELTPAEVFAAKLVLGLGILGVGLAITPIVAFALILALPVAFAGYVFPTEYLAARGRARREQLLRELPDFLSVVRPLAPKHGLEHSVADVANALHAASGGTNLLARQVRSAVAAYGTGVDLYEALTDVATAADLEELDELAAGLAQARRLGRGVPDVLADHERTLRESERNRLLGSASTVQPKLALILAAVYLPAFVVLVLVPLFLSTLGRI
jgi:Flp pilus assembly protein TadB